MKQDLELELNALQLELQDSKQMVMKIDLAILDAKRSINEIINHFYKVGFWARPKRSKYIKRNKF